MGQKFDSKLEARWYECLYNWAHCMSLTRNDVPTIRLPDRTTYTPDFTGVYIPKTKWTDHTEQARLFMLEVKPVRPSDSYILKLKKACRTIHNRNRDIALDFWLGYGNIWHEDPWPTIHEITPNGVGKAVTFQTGIPFHLGQNLRLDLLAE